MHMSSSVRIVVSGIGDAEVIEFQVAPDDTVQMLKHHIADDLRIAPGCQKLVLEDSVKSDSECVRDLLTQDCEVLSLTLVLSNEGLEELYEKLQEFSTAIEAALDAMGMWFSRGTGDERAIRAVIAQFEKRVTLTKMPGPSKEQLLAAKTLQNIVVKGDDFAVTEVIKCLDQKRSYLAREVAFMVLPSIVEMGDARALDALGKYLEDSDENVRKSAVASFVKVAGQDNSQATALVINHLSHPEPGVRESAALCVGQIAMKGDPRVIQALNEISKDPVGCVKRAAAQALEQLVDD